MTGRRLVLAAGSLAATVATLSLSNRKESSAHCAGATRVPPEGIAGTNLERTFIAIKPDGVQRQLIGKIIQRSETGQASKQTAGL